MKSREPSENAMTNFLGLKATKGREELAAAFGRMPEYLRSGRVRKATKKHTTPPAKQARNPRNL